MNTCCSSLRNDHSKFMWLEKEDSSYIRQHFRSMNLITFLKSSIGAILRNLKLFLKHTQTHIHTHTYTHTQFTLQLNEKENSPDHDLSTFLWIVSVDHWVMQEDITICQIIKCSKFYMRITLDHCMDLKC